ncbi:hypothetical protein FA95DRAFT_1506960 [Auriscalpium vulgare]|uniref:Uncharacterized protein n=1 Tax=Auriscalpium vulgare TaxID=40419 RepID=A0ACB8R065_9AGAM|nr:hypothetical protein FA95DRAFT_1506960 [Auriscalpium vulgare]
MGNLSNAEWTTGVDQYKDYTVEQLWQALGITTGQLPFFHPKVDLEGSKTPSLDRAWFEEEGNGVPLVPHWHQLVGICRMLDCAFEGKPVLLMDDVGLGKTLQVIGFFAMLAWYREERRQDRPYPGQFGEFGGPNHPTGRVPNAPFLMVVPPGLVGQVAHEVGRFLRADAIPVQPITGSVVNRLGALDEIKKRTGNRYNNTILLMSSSVLSTFSTSAS